MTGTIWPVLIDFWGGARRGATLRRRRTTDERCALRRATGRRRRATLAELAETCPENFRCWSLLLSAEHQARGSRPRPRRPALYDEAIATRRRRRNLQQEALANELVRRGCGCPRHDDMPRATAC